MKDFMVDALILLMRDHSYHSITIGQITSKAGGNRATYYRNFQSKEEIIKRFYCRILDEGVSRVSMPETIVLENYLVLMFHAFYEQKDALLTGEDRQLRQTDRVRYQGTLFTGRDGG